MRVILLLAVLFLPVAASATQGQTLSGAAEKLSRELYQSICRELRPQDTQCAIIIESATHHQRAPDVSLWALTWKATTPFRLKSEKADTLRAVLEKKQAQVLDIFPDYFKGIAYFRQQAHAFEKLSNAEFSHLALNTPYKAVARLSPELFQTGDPAYALPAKWQSEGLSGSDRGAITLTIPPTKKDHLSIRLRDLDDAPLKGIRIESCSLSVNGRKVACNPDSFEPGKKTAIVNLTLVAVRKLKSSQPAFKLVLSDAASGTLLLHLAIPYKPGPNFVVFGVAGFLFGGLIAVMVLFLRRKPATGEIA